MTCHYAWSTHREFVHRPVCESRASAPMGTCTISGVPAAGFEIAPPVGDGSSRQRRMPVEACRDCFCICDEFAQGLNRHRGMHGDAEKLADTPASVRF